MAFPCEYSRGLIRRRMSLIATHLQYFFSTLRVVDLNSGGELNDEVENLRLQIVETKKRE